VCARSVTRICEYKDTKAKSIRPWAILGININYKNPGLQECKYVGIRKIRTPKVRI
jgi:hypothetical protein